MRDINKPELDELLDKLRKLGYDPLGVLFYDSKLKVLGIAQVEHVPDAWIEEIGRRLSGDDGRNKTQWTTLVTEKKR